MPVVSAKSTKTRKKARKAKVPIKQAWVAEPAYDGKCEGTKVWDLNCANVFFNYVLPTVQRVVNLKLKEVHSAS